MDDGKILGLIKISEIFGLIKYRAQFKFKNIWILTAGRRLMDGRSAKYIVVEAPV
jgi:hypothetical protein